MSARETPHSSGRVAGPGPKRLKSGVGRAEGVLDPLDVFLTGVVGIDCDNVEAHDAVRVLVSFRSKQCRSPNQFALLVNIDGQAGARKTVAGAVAHLDEDQAAVIFHNEVNFAQAATKILYDSDQALSVQELMRELLGVESYSSRVESGHASSSAASGLRSSASSLMSRIGPPAGSMSGNATASPR